jgi:galactose oxidase
MLFAISQAGVASLARIIQIGSLPAHHPEAASPIIGEENVQVIPSEKTHAESLDEAVRSHATDTRVTIGATPKCPYGLGACWAGAYEALKGLNRVAAVRPNC